MNNSATPLRVVGYVRVSTERQTLNDSCEAQESQIRAWAEAHGFEVVAISYESGQTGTVDETGRPGLLEAMRMVASDEADALVIKELDRFSRKLHVQEAVLLRIWEAGAEVWEVIGDREVPRDDPEDPMRTAMRQMQGVFNQLERGMVVRRLQGARKRKKARGGYIGGTTGYGHVLRDGEVVEVPAEQEVLAWLREQRKPDGSGATFQALADALNARGVPTKRGAGQWRANTVRSVLVNAAARQPVAA
jgi:DNA invertase Pin-like site-specific DNA recombinase